MRELIWFLDPAARAAFEATGRLHHAFFTTSVDLIGSTWTYVLTFIIVVPMLGARVVHVRFTDYRPDEPIVHVADPRSSPHRYGDNSLCMWHPRDRPEKRWCLGDGLAALVGYIQAHLRREDWWRRMDEWLGPEAPHGPQPSAPTKAVAR